MARAEGVAVSTYVRDFGGWGDGTALNPDCGHDLYESICVLRIIQSLLQQSILLDIIFLNKILNFH